MEKKLKYHFRPFYALKAFPFFPFCRLILWYVVEYANSNIIMLVNGSQESSITDKRETKNLVT